VSFNLIPHLWGSDTFLVRGWEVPGENSISWTTCTRCRACSSMRGHPLIMNYGQNVVKTLF
jgi:hypothetical protein